MSTLALLSNSQLKELGIVSMGKQAVLKEACCTSVSSNSMIKIVMF